MKYLYYAKSLWNHRGFLTWGAAKRLAANTILTRLGFPRIRNVQIAITAECNASCSYCSSNLLYQPDGQELTLQEWKYAVDELKALGCTHFDITGGEPTLRMELLLGLISYINKNRDSVVSVATNGFGIGGERIRALAAAGLTALEFNTQTAKQLEANPWIAEARKAGLHPCANTCLADQNWDQIAGLMEACDKAKVHCLLNLGAPTGRLAEKQVRISDRKKEYYKLLYSHPYSRSDTTYNYRGPDMCPGGTEKVYITPYGDVFTCTFTQVSYGNLRREPLSLIYGRMLSNPWVTKREKCKHTFNEAYRKAWVDPVINNKPPTPLAEHPLYDEIYNTMPDAKRYLTGLGFLFKYLIKEKVHVIEKLLWRAK